MGGSVMKKPLVSLVAVILCAPTSSYAVQPFGAPDATPQAFLYVRLPFGASRSVSEHNTPRFGLSLSREFSTGSDTHSLFRPNRLLPFFDVQFGGRDASMRFNGANMASSGGGSIWKNPWLWVGIAAGALVISCVTENFPCEDDSSGSGGGGY